MTLIGVVLVLVVIGFLLWLLNATVPMDARIRAIINAVVVVVVLLWLLRVFGLVGGLGLDVPLRGR